MKIAILGSPCSGKTTLIKLLGKDKYIKNTFNKVIVVEDLARIFVEYGNLLRWKSQDGLNKIAKGYEQILEEIVDENDILISDLSSLITEFYLYRVENISLTTLKKDYYDLVFFCLPVDKQIQDNGRQFTPEEMLKINNEMLDFYEKCGVKLILLADQNMPGVNGNSKIDYRKLEIINKIKDIRKGKQNGGCDFCRK